MWKLSYFWVKMQMEWGKKKGSFPSFAYKLFQIGELDKVMDAD